MQIKSRCGRLLLVGSVLALSFPYSLQASETHRHHRHTSHSAHVWRASSKTRNLHASRTRHHLWVSAGVRYASAYRRLQCVAYARGVTGIAISGNAGTWWHQAGGLYQRGKRPEPGAVLAFAPNGRMPLGHVAVVAGVINPREIVVDHANWGNGGRVSRNVPVVDISDNNDWSAVRVALGQRGNFGSIYPTFGFIYNRPDHGVMVAAGPVTPVPQLEPAPADLRAARSAYAGRVDQSYVEVAQAPSHLQRLRPESPNGG